MMKSGMLTIAALLCIYLVPAYAERPSCPMTEDTQVNISFNSHEPDLKQVKSIIDDIQKEIETLAKEAGIEQFEMQSMSYNIHANNPSGYNCPRGVACQRTYQLNGNMSFKVGASDKSIDLMVLINNKGYSGSMNVNKYRQCR